MKAVIIRKIIVKYVPMDGMTKKEENTIQILTIVVAILALASVLLFVVGLVYG